MQKARAVVLWGAVIGVGAAMSVAACGDSIHLDPPKANGGGGQGTSTTTSGPGGGATTGGEGGGGHGGMGATSTTTTVGSGGMGGSAPVECSSNSDCPAPTSICDTEKHKCVECLQFQDCGFRPGTVCSMGLCTCPDANEAYCDALGNEPARCVDQKTSSQDCGACGHGCFGACNAGKCADAWEPTSLVDAPEARRRHTAIWTGSNVANCNGCKMIVWGGETPGYTNTGGMYDPATFTWAPTSIANAPSPRSFATAVWTGTYMLVWGGFDGSPLGNGGRFDPATNTWKPIPTSGAPSARYWHTAVWAPNAGQGGTGEMIVWGGYDGNNSLGDGAAYDPVSESWAPVPSDGNTPSARREHVAVMANQFMVVYGGIGFDPNQASDNVYLAGGSYFDTSANGQNWSLVSQGSQPSARTKHRAVWTGQSGYMLLWGGYDGGSFLDTGGIFDFNNGWRQLPQGPSARQNHTAVWAGNLMLVWGGDNNGAHLGTGALVNADSDVNNIVWSAMPNAPIGRSLHTAILTNDNKMIVWGGETDNGLTNTGAVFDPAF